MIFSHPAHAIALFLKPLQHGIALTGQDIILIAQAAMFMGIAPCEHGHARRDAHRVITECMGTKRAPLGHGIQVRRDGIGMPETAHGIATHLVADHHEDIGRTLRCTCLHAAAHEPGECHSTTLGEKTTATQVFGGHGVAHNYRTLFWVSNSSFSA